MGLRVEVYPRVYGGTTVLCPIRAAVTQGLSPRVRGNPVTQGCACLCRSIPACTGEPATEGSRRPPAIGLSPRVRGNRRPRNGSRWGLSPRVRGNQPDLQHLGQVYPRVYGGTILARICDLRRSIPACTLVIAVYCGGQQRSIPACTGEPRRPVTDMQVYPRVYGGTLQGKLTELAHCTAGLSPRVRGNPSRQRLFHYFGEGLSPRVRGNR